MIHWIARQGSISACAEEPLSRRSLGCSLRVDLRMRGGAPSCWPPQNPKWGRSPHARRSLVPGCIACPRPRSISACAEEPLHGATRKRGQGVDLRMRGGAAATNPILNDMTGRSPHARRSPGRDVQESVRGGSISACAEEPSDQEPTPWPTQVDLRMRGGALRSNNRPSLEAGRSPHARRSPFAVPPAMRAGGSISACAEEPLQAKCLKSNDYQARVVKELLRAARGNGAG